MNLNRTLKVSCLSYSSFLLSKKLQNHSLVMMWWNKEIISWEMRLRKKLWGLRFKRWKIELALITHLCTHLSFKKDNYKLNIKRVLSFTRNSNFWNLILKNQKFSKTQIYLMHHLSIHKFNRQFLISLVQNQWNAVF